MTSSMSPHPEKNQNIQSPRSCKSSLTELTAFITKLHAGGRVTKGSALVETRLDRVVVGVDDLVGENAVLGITIVILSMTIQ